MLNKRGRRIILGSSRRSKLNYTLQLGKAHKPTKPPRVTYLGIYLARSSAANSEPINFGSQGNSAPMLFSSASVSILGDSSHSSEICFPFESISTCCQGTGSSSSHFLAVPLLLQNRQIAAGARTQARVTARKILRLGWDEY
jgi:hypothetical protein